MSVTVPNVETATMYAADELAMTGMCRIYVHGHCDSDCPYHDAIRRTRTLLRILRGDRHDVRRRAHIARSSHGADW